MENEWDYYVSNLVKKFNLNGYLPAKYTDEVDVIRRLSDVPGLCESIRLFLQNLPNVRADGEEKSNQFRERGNAIFKSKENVHLALEAYSKAIFAAPAGSSALALGHANRAVILIRFGLYREAYDDCQLALDGGYPEATRLKIFFRQAECVVRLNDMEKLSKITHSISTLATSKRLTKAEQERLLELERLCKTTIGNTELQKEACEEKLHFPALKNMEAPTKGRYVITKEPIDENQLITRETAVSFVPVYDSEARSSLPSFDCQKCASVNVVPFPCSTCGRACYCGPKCREEHKIHRYECFGYKKHLWYLIGIAHLGIRCFLDGFNSIRDEVLMAKDALTCYCNLKESTEGTDKPLGPYGQVLRLVPNLENMDQEDVLQYSLAGLLLSIYIRDCTDFFSEQSLTHDGMSSSELFVLCGALILRHLGQLVCNGHAISELRAALPSACGCLEDEGIQLKPGGLYRYFSSSRVFTAIFPTISMFNHSCDPNIRNYFDRSTLTVYGTRRIAAGEEIFNCYGPNYKLMPRVERQLLLKQQYCFECGCDRCQAEDDSFSNIYNMIKCDAQDCGRQFFKELEPNELPEGFECVHCGNEIVCGWYNTVQDVVESDGPYVKSNFQRCLNALEASKRVLCRFNRIRVSMVHCVLDRFMEYAGIDEFSWRSLKKLALEFISLRRHQFGRMSLEYMTACFYIVDLLTIEYCCTGGQESLELDEEISEILANFRATLNMVGERSRSLILGYLSKYINTQV